MRDTTMTSDFRDLENYHISLHFSEKHLRFLHRKSYGHAIAK